MKTVIWHPGVEEDLEEIVDHIATSNLTKFGRGCFKL